MILKTRLDQDECSKCFHSFEPRGSKQFLEAPRSMKATKGWLREARSWSGSGTGSEVRHPRRAESRTSSPLVATSLQLKHVRRKLKHVSSLPPPRVLNTSKFSESPFLRHTLCFTRKLLPVSQQTRIIRNEREWLTIIFPLAPRSGIFRFEARRCGQVAHDG